MSDEPSYTPGGGALPPEIAERFRRVNEALKAVHQANIPELEGVPVWSAAVDLDALCREMVRLAQEASRYDVAQMGAWDAIRDAVSTMLGVPHAEVKYGADAAERLRELAREYAVMRQSAEADLDLDAIEARASAAHPAPWELPPEDEREAHHYHRVTLSGTDAVFAACAREDVPRLVARVRALQTTRNEAREDCERAARARFAEQVSWSASSPDTTPEHHRGALPDDVLERVRQLALLEQAVARYLDVLDGRLGPLDTTTPAEALGALRELAGRE